MGFSRQEYWSGLSFSSTGDLPDTGIKPGSPALKVKKVKALVTQSCPILCDPMDCSPPGSSVHEILQGRILEWVPFPSPGDLPDPWIKPRSPASQVDSLPGKPLGKPSPALKADSLLSKPPLCMSMNL